MLLQRIDNVSLDVAAYANRGSIGTRKGVDRSRARHPRGGMGWQPSADVPRADENYEAGTCPWKY
jgi:hypothetical protein